MLDNPLKVQPINSSFPAHHAVNQPQRSISPRQRVSREMAARSALKLVPGSGERKIAEVRPEPPAPRKAGLRLMDAGFFVLALGMAAVMWWSITVN